MTGSGLDKTLIRCAGANAYPTGTATQIQFQCKLDEFGLQYIEVENYPYDGLMDSFANKRVGISVTAAPDGYTNTGITPDIYTAGVLDIGKPVQVKGNGPYFYAVNLTAGVMYSFDAGTALEFNDFDLYDRTGTPVGISTFYNHFGWTPSASGTYFLRANAGSILTVKNEGNATSDPYKMLIKGVPSDPEGIWLGDSRSFLFLAQPTTYVSSINIHKNGTYEFEVRTTSFVPKAIKLINGNAQEQFSFTLPARNKATLKFTANTSDTYYLQASSNSDSGGQIVMKAKYLVDSDHDGDPDATDPFPLDPNKNSSTGNGSGNTDLAACAAKSYTGDTSDPQVYFYDYIAQFDQCAYRATKNQDYVIDGDRQCKVLDGLLKSIQSTFKPQYCNGALLIK